MALSGQNFATPIAIIIAGALIGGSILWSSDRAVQQRAPVLTAPQQAQSTAPVQPPVDVADVLTSGEPSLGSATAPVVMAFWSDYQCPFCRQVETEVIPRLVDDYVKTGKLRIVFKDFQFLGADSQTAGLAARAVWDVAPDRFYDWHKAMFDHQDGENTGWGTKDDILALTKTIPGVDAAKVEQQMSDHFGVYQKAIDADLTEGNAFGISGTPGTIIGKQLLVGAQPLTAFKAAIDAAAANLK